MRCPRCRRETPDPAPAFCRGCGAPLRLGEDPAPASLELAVPIDRRGGGTGASVATFAGIAPHAAAIVGAGATPMPAPRVETERSHWNLGAPGVPAALRRGPAEAEAPLRAAGEEPTFPDAEVDALEIHVRRPETWRRVLAGSIDAVPFVAGGVALARAFVREASAGLPAPATGLDGLLDLLARERVIVVSLSVAIVLALGVYATLAHALAGATLGKRLLGLRVVSSQGARPSMGRSAARSALAVLSAALLGLGFLLSLFTRSGRALHDLLARTWVVGAP